MRTNCIQYIDIQQNSVLKLEKVAKKFTTPGRIARQRRMAHQSVSQSDNLEDTRNLVLEDLVSQLKKTDFKREVNMTLQREDTVNYPTTMVQEASTTLQDDNSNPPTTATVNDNDHATLSFSFKNKSQNGLDTAPDHNTKEPTLPLASSYFGNIKGLLTILISVSVVGIAILVLVSIAVFIACACWRRQSGHLPGSSCTVTCCAKYINVRDGEASEYLPVSLDTTPPTSGDLMDDTSDNQDREHFDNETTNLIDNETVTMLQVSDDLNLLNIPPDLEEILVTSLDVPHNDSDVYGWQKVGNAAEIPPHVLKYYKYARESPTKSLLEKLGSQGRTISYLIDVLRKPSVGLGSVAETIIRHRATRI
ncbi:hypothetical protein OS493_029260 [Desmophyllum pertusum]|uniref:Death domain-containing protein n=1 Tax=Desmophyllum pertusum TaxID=174260 RepID=A0A9X0D1D9_9CNID|nr:hypothetical protein OS493_029260 [Desmophyllum pertusum]